MAKRKKPKAKTIPGIVSEPGEPFYSGRYDWVSPGRPATDQEIDELIASWKNSPSYPLEEAKKRSFELIRKWREQER